MPNWSYTNIFIIHSDQEKLRTLYDCFKTWTEINTCNDVYGLTGLKNIVANAGIKGNFYYRGKIEDFSLLDGQLNISTETAWRPSLQMFKEIKDRYLPEAEIHFYTDLTDEGFYATNDSAYEGVWLVENIGCDTFDCDEREDVPEDILVEKLKALFHSSSDNIDCLMKLYEDSDYTDLLYFHKWDYMSIDEFD